MASYRTAADELVTLEERAAFYPRCSLFEDLAYGLQTGRTQYVDKSLAALAWLFPPPADTGHEPGADRRGAAGAGHLLGPPAA